ncbi:MAG: class I SAM-dependent methyltransferase [Verrucomicrobiae bacterium]|nr:class I SAM-dependent methyltransferase [Verrucomicrobiae bacterium]
MTASKILNRVLYDREGEPRPILSARMQLAKFAATRGWVIPYLTTRAGISEKWRKASLGGPLGYQTYLELTPVSEAILAQIIARVSPGESILDLGCNVGRELNALWKKGYRNLTGVEIGEEPVKAMKSAFPELAAGARIINDSMAEALLNLGSGEFDLVYAHGSLVSLNAREQYVFDEICRVSRKWVITLENEWSMLLFPRDFGEVFRRRGLRQVHHELVRVGSRKRSALRVFAKEDAGS